MPFYLRTGKRLPKRVTQIVIQFKHAPARLFQHTSVDRLTTNRLSESRATWSQQSPRRSSPRLPLTAALASSTTRCASTVHRGSVNSASIRSVGALAGIVRVRPLVRHDVQAWDDTFAILKRLRNITPKASPDRLKALE